MQTDSEKVQTSKTSLKVMNERASCPFCESDWKPAWLKSFSAERAYGFFNVAGEKRDIYVHASLLRVSGFIAAPPRNTTCFEIIYHERPDGRLNATNIRWLNKG